MSLQKGPAKRPPQEEGPSPSELMRQMGVPSAYFDPMPPSQHASLMDIDEPEHIRILARLYHGTIRKGPKGRSPYARDEEGRPLTRAQIAADLDLQPQNVSRGLAKLFEAGRAKPGKGGQFYLCGDVSEPRRIKGETKNGRICTDSLPDYVLLHLQQLNEKDRATFLQRHAAEERAEKDALADAAAAVRECWSARFKKLYQTVGLTPKELPKRRDETERPPLVKVQLMLPEFESVQISSNGHSVQSENGALYTVENDFVQGPASLLTSENSESLRVSKEPPPAAATVSAERPLPTFSGPPPPKTPPEAMAAEAFDPVVADAERIFKQTLSAKNPLRAHFAALPARFGVPARSVCRFFGDAMKKKRRAGYPVESLGALYKFALEDLSGWIAQNGDSIFRDERDEELDRERAAHPVREEKPFDAGAFNAELRELTGKKGMKP